MSVSVNRRGFVAGAIGAGVALSAPAVRGQASAWPSKPVKVTVTFPAGGLTDVWARTYGEYASQKLGQSFIVENKTGASGAIGAEQAAKSPPDGYHLMFTISTTMVMNKVLFKKLPYDPDKDFVPVAFFSAGHLPFIVHKDVPAKNIKEFVDFARKNKVSIGTYGAGSYSHVVVAELNKFFGLSMEAVHYRGEAPMWQDLASGAIHAGSGSYAASAGVLQSGTGRAIAVPMTTRMKKLPDVGTFLEQGVTARGFQLRGWIGAFYQTGTPKEIVEKLSALFVECGRTEKVQKILDTFGIDEGARDHAFMKKVIDEEGPVWMELVKSLGVTPQ
ncbi:MAG: tripartite tricarboxylate transporter substrate binding protein [Alphaproteobacteria bacterium]|nr:tripartite tricarboxylate transporter substrate binding protein [Alphaproteobacteria bacterium]MCW5742546.1 tripartite tricarboxylate transporter substrate binding protein [Alphaproteobacteria bacterium]